MAIDTDYSFLNLPEAGSSAQGPIARPSFDPTDFSFNLDRYAPRNLPNVGMVAPSLPSFSADRNEAVLNSARPFEDIRTLGATFGQKLAETERFFGERVSSLQGNIDDLINTKSDLTKQLEAAFLQQDEMSQQAIEEQIAALDKQRAELVAQLEASVAEAEAEGVDAVAAAEKITADQRQEFEGQISGLDQQLQDLEASKQEAIAAGDQQRVAELEAQEQTLIQQRDELVAQMEQQFGGERGELEARIAEIESAQQAAIAERDQAIAEQDTIRAQAAEQQAQALEGLKQELLTERAGIVGGLEGTIGDLQGEIDGLTGARDSAIAERDQAIAQQDTIRAESADAQAQALDAQAGDYQAQLDELTGQSTQYQGQVTERDQTIADLQAQIAALQGAEQPPVNTPPSSGVGPGGGEPGFYDNPPPSKGGSQLFIDDGPGFNNEKVGGPVFGPGDEDGLPINIGGPALTTPIANPKNPGMLKIIEDKIRDAGGERIVYGEPKPVAKTPAKTPPKKPISYGGLGGFGGKRGGGRSFVR